MSGSQTFPKLSKRAVEEHGVIHFHLDQLERALVDLDPANPTDEKLRTVAVRIDSFKERLTEHFGTEEDGGLLQGIQDALPQAESDVRRLRAQHARLDEALERVRAIARRGEAADVPVLKTELDRFLALMREHERDEDALLKRALRQDECLTPSSSSWSSSPSSLPPSRVTWSRFRLRRWKPQRRRWNWRSASWASCRCSWGS